MTEDSFLLEAVVGFAQRHILDYIYIYDCNLVDTRWQQHSTHIHTNSTHNTAVHHTVTHKQYTEQQNETEHTDGSGGEEKNSDG
jgi:hypothetical protein